MLPVGRAIALAIALTGMALPLAAHDIAPSVTVQMILRPAGKEAHLLVRVPLVALRDIDFPTQGLLKDGVYLDVEHADRFLHDAAVTWLANEIDLYEDGRELPTPEVRLVRASLPSDRSFTSYEAAMEHLRAPPLPNSIQLPAEQAMLDALLVYPITSDRAAFSMRPSLARLGIDVLTVLRFMPPGGAVRPFEYRGDPGLIRLDPSFLQAFGRFIGLGFEHILGGLDHLLFLACLVIPFRKLRALIWVVTAFTVAHSVTLAMAAFGMVPSALWFPPLVETLIAASIFYMALENIVGKSSLQRRWMLTFGFGLIHGFGLSFALRESLQFAGNHLITSLLAFNLGVELGQLAVLVVLVPALDLLFRYVVEERMGTIILSAIVADTAWHWMRERWADLRQYEFTWPSLSTPTLSESLKIAAFVVAMAGLVVAAHRAAKLEGDAAVDGGGRGRKGRRLTRFPRCSRICCQDCTAAEDASDLRYSGAQS